MENGCNGSLCGRHPLPKKSREARRPGGVGGKRWWRRLRRRDDSVDFLHVAALMERKQQAWEATGTSSVTGRGGDASTPGGASDMRRRRRFQEENERYAAGSNGMENKR
jgi:hypothetical protein